MAAAFKEEELPVVQRAEHYCSVSEQCITSVRAKLISWGVERTFIERVITHLVDKGYVDEKRYAYAYCEAKLRSQKWGRMKIAFQLRSKQLPKTLVDEAVASLDPEQYQQVLTNLAQTKWKSYGDMELKKKRQKLMVFLQTKGFAPDEIQETAAEMVKGEE